MAATQRDSFCPPDRTQSRFLSVKVFRPKCEGGYLEEDQLDSQLIGKSEVMQALKKSIRLVANSSETVLITGETGTGKELIARAIHDQSLRRTKSFLAVNCGALNQSVLESELFGHVKGAFTGATTNKKGFFEVEAAAHFFSMSSLKCRWPHNRDCYGFSKKEPCDLSGVLKLRRFRLTRESWSRHITI
jgi:transcriptional regulator with AAA-type ATPase domain